MRTRTRQRAGRAPRRRSAEACKVGPGAYVHRELTHSHEDEAPDDSGAGARSGGESGQVGARVHRQRRVFARRCGTLGSRFPLPLAGSDHCRGCQHDQHSGHRRLHAALAVRRFDQESARAHSQRRQGSLVGTLPQRSRNGGRELARIGHEWRTAGGVHDKRARRARRQRIAGRGRDGGQDAQGCVSMYDAHRYHPDRRGVEAGVGDHRISSAAEQGDRGGECIFTRVRHPPGRRAEAPRDLRNHARGRRGLECEQAGARQTLRQKRIQEPAWRARHRSRQRGCRQSRIRAVQGARRQERRGVRRGFARARVR